MNEEMKALLKKAQGSIKGARILFDASNPVNPVHPVQTVASLSTAPDSLKILKFIGAPVEELTNKTAIKEYYEAGFDGLAGALAKNKKKLKHGYDPTRREPKEKLHEKYEIRCYHYSIYN